MPWVRCCHWLASNALRLLPSVSLSSIRLSAKTGSSVTPKQAVNSRRKRRCGVLISELEIEECRLPVQVDDGDEAEQPDRQRGAGGGLPAQPCRRHALGHIQRRAVGGHDLLGVGCEPDDQQRNPYPVECAAHDQVVGRAERYALLNQPLAGIT